MGRTAGVSPEETRARLVEAAARVFAERGYEGASVAAIVEEAGLTSGAIYAHYGSKAELLVEAIRSYGADELGRLVAGDDATSAPELLVALGARLGDRPPAQSSLLVEAIVAGRRDPEVASVLSSAVLGREQLLAEILRLGQLSGELDEDLPPHAAARLCMMLLLGSMLLGSLELPPTERGDWSSLVTRLVGAFRPAERS